jgi:hypothetical protein
LRQCVPKLEIGNAMDHTIDRSVVLSCYIQAHLYKGKWGLGYWMCKALRIVQVASDMAWRRFSVSVLAPLVVGIVELLSHSQFAVSMVSVGCHTLGSVTFGITTTLSAEGASFLTLVSPPGWYWYGPEPPSSFQGSLPCALATLRSDEALVGERAKECKSKKQRFGCTRVVAYRNAILPDQTHHS